MCNSRCVFSSVANAAGVGAVVTAVGASVAPGSGASVGALVAAVGSAVGSFVGVVGGSKSAVQRAMPADKRTSSIHPLNGSSPFGLAPIDTWYVTWFKAHEVVLMAASRFPSRNK